MKRLIIILAVLLCCGTAFGVTFTNQGLIDRVVLIQDSLDAVYDTLGVVQDSLEAISDSLVVIREEVIETEVHLHSYECWFEEAGTPTGETHIAVKVGDSDGAAGFDLDAGNDTWSAWVQVLGSEDTPCREGKVKYDFHEVLFTDNERTALYFVQFAFGETGAGAFAADEYTTVPYFPAAVNIRSGVALVKGTRHLAGTKVWARIMCDGQNTATLSFIFGLHEYDE
jgi:hypothetical protein